MSSVCNLCSKELATKNLATFPCGHSFHLSCVLAVPYDVKCSTCNQCNQVGADVGTDRRIAMNADLIMKVEQRRLKPIQKSGMFSGIVSLITPLTPSPQTFVDHMKQNKKLSVISAAGFGPEDAVQERVRFSDIVTRYEAKDILEFGFNWTHMVTLGILPPHLKHFTWTQQIHKLKLNVEKMLKMRLTITELADMNYTTHQLVELGFTWSVMASMGANVDTWKRFNFELEDIKRYWTPTLSQWVAAGFYDKDRVKHAGWPMETVIQTLPAMDQRAQGRVLRLAF
jgi:hypothetical protein